MIGDVVQLSCLAARGDTPITLTWVFRPPPGYFQDDRPSGIRVTQLGQFNSLLFVPRAAPHHRGTYICTATNPAGQDSIEMQLTVNGMF